MNGKIKVFFEDKAYGFILGDDGTDYFFHIRDVQSTDTLFRGTSVTFSISETAKGRAAKNVIIYDNHRKDKPAFICLGGQRIKLSNIRDYGITQVQRSKVKVYEYTVHSYDNTFVNMLKGYTDYEWNGLTIPVATDMIRDSTELAYGKCFPAVEIYILDEVTGSYTWSKKQVIKNSKGQITRGTPLIKNSDFINESVDALFIKTYQGDNFVWAQSELDSDIHQKCAELDKYLAI